MTLDFENMWGALWFYLQDYVFTVMVLFFVLTVGILVYRWFKIKDSEL